MGRGWSDQKSTRAWSSKNPLGGSSYSATTNTHEISFDGANETISFGDVLNKAHTDAWSHAIWATPANTSQSGTLLWSKQNNISTEFRGWNWWQAGTGLILFYINDASGGPVNYLQMTWNSFFTASTQVHICVTLDGSADASGLTLYKNGTATAASSNRS